MKSHPQAGWAIAVGARAPLLAVALGCGAASAATAPPEILTAHPAVRYDPKERCPELRVSDEGDTVSVLFVVSANGVPSQASVRTPSLVDGLDAAALSCIVRLRFQPATRPGDAQPVDSWQRISLRWAASAHAAAGVPTPDAPGPGGAAAAGAPRIAAGATASAHADTGTTVVRVCADAAGALTQDPVVTRSSGAAAQDAAALRIARAGSGNYRPAPATGTAAVTGCAQLAITFEVK